ncbi:MULTISPECIES: response regulator [Flammeovirga]|uniref:Response regulator n=1 Tax=Flammeovirga agarivorans TaxID=2726742 RepID=A0A7X8SMR8_9BACT|nr:MULTISPECIES: response regulator [Flammeovirga]NLR93042.1 response regulator [Flammeovirga agarivorans]
MSQLNHILLIDDSESINFYNRLIIEETGVTKKCTFFLSAEEGLEYIKEEHNENNPLPEIIFLDINMPKMNGWDFLDAYDQLDESLRKKITLFMLTTSTNEDDKAKANTYNTVKGFLSKPLTEDSLRSALLLREKVVL